MAHILDEFDLRMIALLREDGRLSNVEIGRRLGLAEGTVRKRLDRLVSEHIIHIMAIVEPAALGLNASVLINIQTELGEMNVVAHRLAQLPEVHSVSMITGSYDVLVEVLLPSSDRLLSFLIDKISTIPGVKRTETSQVLQVVKRACDWAVPSLPVEQAPSPSNAITSDAQVVPGAIVIAS